MNVSAGRWGVNMVIIYHCSDDQFKGETRGSTRYGDSVMPIKYDIGEQEEISQVIDIYNR